MSTAEASLNTAAPANPLTAPPAGEMARRVGRNSLWLIGQPLLLNVLSVVSTGYIARKLGATDYGLFNLGFAQVALFAPLCNLGLRGVAVRAVARDRENAEQITGVLLTLRLLAIGVAALLALAWLFLTPLTTTTRLIGGAAIISMLATGTGYAAVDLFQGFERSRLAAQPQLIGGLSITALSVAALLMGAGLTGFVAAYAGGALLQMGLLLFTAQRHYFQLHPRWDTERMRALLWETRPFALMRVVDALTTASVLDVVLLGIFAGEGSVGAYSAAIGLVARLLIVPLGIGDALYPAVSHAHGKSREETAAVVRRYVLTLALLTLPVALWLSFAAPTVLWILFGNQYLSAAPQLALAGWLLPLGGLSYVIRECLSAAHRQGTVARLHVAAGVLHVLLLALLIPVWGATGAVLAMLLRELLILPLWTRPFSAEFPHPFSSPETRKAAVPFAAFLALLAPLAWPHPHWLTVALSFAAWGTYALTAWKLGLLKRN